MPQLGSMATATLGALIISTVLAGCGQSTPPPVTRPPVIKSAILHIYPTPAGTESAAGPSQGTLWVLAGSPQTQALFPLPLGQHTIGHGLPLSAASRTVALLKNQTLAVGLATAKAGAVQWLSAPYAKVQALCPLPGPVLDAAAGPHGQHLFVLYQTPTQVMAGVVPLLATKPTATWAVPSSTVSLAPGPKGAHVYTLTSAGQVTEWPVASPHPALTQFVVGQSGTQPARHPPLRTEGTGTGPQYCCRIDCYRKCAESIASASCQPPNPHERQWQRSVCRGGHLRLRQYPDDYRASLLNARAGAPAAWSTVHH